MLCIANILIIIEDEYKSKTIGSFTSGEPMVDAFRAKHPVNYRGG